MRISVTVAKAQLTEPARRAENGDEIVLTRHGHAAVRLVPVKAALDRESRRAILEAARAAGSAKAKAGPSAARSQDFLYGAPVIAVDTSALMAIVLGEPDAGACIAAFDALPLEAPQKKLRRAAAAVAVTMANPSRSMMLVTSAPTLRRADTISASSDGSWAVS